MIKVYRENEVGQKWEGGEIGRIEGKIQKKKKRKNNTDQMNVLKKLLAQLPEKLTSILVVNAKPTKYIT